MDRSPHRRGGLGTGLLILAIAVSVGAVTAVFALLINVWLDERESAAAVNPIVERTYVKRSGLAKVTADCASESGWGEDEGWRCRIASSSVAGDRCLVFITGREIDQPMADIQGCDRDAAAVNPVVRRAYLKRSGLANVQADCLHEDFVGKEGPNESWPCDMTWGPAASGSDHCVVTITRRDRGRLSAHVTFCESDG